MTQGIITGTMVGAAVGVMMFLRSRRENSPSMMATATQLNRRSRNTIRLVNDKAKRLTRAVRSGSEAFSKKLARRG